MHAKRNIVSKCNKKIQCSKLKFYIILSRSLKRWAKDQMTNRVCLIMCVCMQITFWNGGCSKWRGRAAGWWIRPGKNKKKNSYILKYKFKSILLKLHLKCICFHRHSYKNFLKRMMKIINLSSLPHLDNLLFLYKKNQSITALLSKIYKIIKI